MNVGLFQLENLLVSQVRFCFLDVRAEHKTVPAQVENLIARAHRLSPADVKAYLEKNLPALDAPVILLSEDGGEAEALRFSLERDGYTNIYVVEGGVEGLLSEL